MRLEPLRRGDIVDIVAPASRCTAEELRKGLQALRKLGLVPRLPKKMYAPSILFSNSDAERLKQLKKALYAPDSKLIWCVRGGYGCVRLLPEMESWKRPKHGKIFLGYSDITTLHTFFNQRWNWPTLHGPLLDRLGRGQMSVPECKQLLRILYGDLEEVSFAGLRPMNAAARASRTIRAPVVGGNMAVLQSSLGTPSQLKVRGKILFLEDTGERPHRVDRMLTQFAQAGYFRDAKAVVFGHFQFAEPKQKHQVWDDVMPRFAAVTPIPVLKGLPVGHDNRRQYTLPFNTEAELKLGRYGSLTVQTGVSV